MSSKKDKFSSEDKKFMKLALNLASNNKSLTGTNPSVGCVLVKDKRIISYGVTGINGRPHAETVAINKNFKNVAGSTAYITLEPCSHYGQTPPCTNALIKSKIKKVFYSIDDVDVRTFQKSKKILNKKKILTRSGLLKKETSFLYKNYNFIKKNKFPYLIGKLAVSSNFFILKNNSHITNEHSRKVSHLLRYLNQGILTSYKTINTDNPRLSCRISGLEMYSPKIIIIDKNLKINSKSFVLNNINKSPTFIFHNSKDSKKIFNLKKKGIKLIYVDIEKNGYFNLKKIFKKLYLIGIHQIIVESGKNLTLEILSQNLFNEFYLFRANKHLKSKNKINIKAVLKKLSSSFKNKRQVNTFLDKDNLIHYY